MAAHSDGVFARSLSMFRSPFTIALCYAAVLHLRSDAIFAGGFSA